MSLHPSSELLALYCGGDIPWTERLKVRRHLSGCEYCERQLSLYNASAAEFKRQARTETLTGFEAIADWSRLEREMQGNIVVGLAAARCIDPKRKPRGLVLKLSLASGLAALFVLGWSTHVPADQTGRLYRAVGLAFSGNHAYERQGSILRSQPGGIVVGSPEGSLTLLHPQSAVVSLSGTSGVEARYIDDDTGQVTITDVYGQ